MMEKPSENEVNINHLLALITTEQLNKKQLDPVFIYPNFNRNKRKRISNQEKKISYQFPHPRPLLRKSLFSFVLFCSTKMRNAAILNYL